MYNLPSNLKSSLHKTWQTLLLFLKPLQIQTLKRKKWGDMAYYNPTWKSGGHVPRVPHQIAPMQPIMTLVQIPNYTSPNCTDRPQVNVHCIEHFFTVHEFWATCACPGKTELPWKFSLCWIYFSHSGFLTTSACPENRVSLKFYTVLNIFFTIQDFWATLCFPWKTEGALNSQYWLYIFYHSGFLSNLRFPSKTELPWNFSLYWNIFYYSGFLSNLRLPWKTEFALKFFKPGGTAAPPRPPPRTPMIKAM